MSVVLVTYPKFKGWNPLTGLPGDGFLVWVYEAGTVDTPLDSYSEHTGTTPNTNPVILDSVGEANIYVKAGAKLVYTTPGGDPTSPIWVVDYYGEQQSNIVTGSATPVTVNNNYVVTTTPAVTALSNNFTLIMTPDVDNAATLVSTVFTGTGINDLIASGAYIGTSLQTPPIAPTAVLSGTGGSVTAGNHYVKLTSVTAAGETTLGAISAVVAADGAHKIDVSGIPALADGITGYNVYMTKAGGTIYYFVATVVLTTYAINTADAALTVVAPTTNTSGSVFTFQIDATPQAAPVAPTLAANGTAGLVDAGNHSVKLTAVTTTGETEPGIASNVINAAGSKQLDVSVIPAVAGEITGYNVYMNKAAGSTWYLVNTAPIVTTTYTINIADATLGTGIYVAAPSTNTTAGAGVADTFKWKKDGGAWHPGIVITGAAQIIIEGIVVTFAVIISHTLGDIWAITVKTPARVNLDTLGNLIVYKNRGGLVVALDGGDMKAGYPVQLVLNAALNAWLLINPATPTFSVPTITANRYRKNIVATYAMLLADQGYELSCTGTFTLTLLTPPEFSGKFLYFKNAGTGMVTLDAGTYNIDNLGHTLPLYPSMGIQLQTNGVDWHILADTNSGGRIEYTVPGTYTFTAGIGFLKEIVVVGGGGGAGNTPPDYFGLGGAVEIYSNYPVTPGASITIVVGTVNAASSFGTLPSAAPGVTDVHVGAVSTVPCKYRTNQAPGFGYFAGLNMNAGGGYGNPNGVTGNGAVYISW